MNKLALLVIMISAIFGNDNYRKKLDDCNMMYIFYKSEYQIVSNAKYYDPCLKLGKVDRSGFDIEEPQDEIDYLEYQKKTLGLACEQVSKKEQVLFKNDYCLFLRSSQKQQFSQNDSKVNSNNAQQFIQPNIQAKIIDPSIKFKNSPQLKMPTLHVYGVKNISYFRDKAEIVLIESEIGNYAVPAQEVKKAERINFKSELSQSLDALLH